MAAERVGVIRVLVCFAEFRCGSWVGESNSCRRRSCSSRDPAGVMASRASRGRRGQHSPHQAEAAGLARQPADDLHPPAGLAEGALDEVGVPDPLMVLDGQAQIAGQLRSVREQTPTADGNRDWQVWAKTSTRFCTASTSFGPGPMPAAAALQRQKSPRTHPSSPAAR